VLMDAALVFLEQLHDKFEKKRQQLLAARLTRGIPDFDPLTADIRTNSWQVAAIPERLKIRHVEITGPAQPKMIINALNSGADCFMADLEDSTSPTWDAIVQGQQALKDAIRGTLKVAENCKHYTLNTTTALLLMRPRGWHLQEAHILVNNHPISGALVDMGLYCFHNAATLLSQGLAPYVYLPKLEHHTEAVLWEEVLSFIERSLNLPAACIKTTVLIETLPAVFQMHEILHALKNRCVALNCGRWDYLFSFIKTLRDNPAYILPPRSQLAMSQPFLTSYAELLIQTCHMRGALAIGGMAAQIPIKGDDAANTAALEKVRQDKQREAGLGHDGTWVAHPALVPIAKQIFVERAPAQPITRTITQADLLAVPKGSISMADVQHSLSVGTTYLHAWLAGNGCVPINHLMEDAATAEICRAQLWQWQKHGVRLDDGQPITAALYQSLCPTLDAAATMFLEMITAPSFSEFLTIVGYEELLKK
jgi:malate synthase